MNGKFNEPCPTCRDLISKKGGIVCLYCGYTLKEGSWVMDAPEGEFRKWFYSFMLAEENKQLAEEKGRIRKSRSPHID